MELARVSDISLTFRFVEKNVLLQQIRPKENAGYDIDIPNFRSSAFKIMPKLSYDALKEYKTVLKQVSMTKKKKSGGMR